jgi:hypothetical protein
VSGVSTPERDRQSKHGTQIAVDRARHARAADLKPEVWADTDFGRDLLRARWDMRFFSERFMGVTPHPGQERLWDALMKRDQSGWRPRYLDVNASAGNRAGKTLGISIPMFHNTFFKIGTRPPNPLDERDLARWTRSAYEWYHFALQQEIAELAYIELTRLLSGTHEAQKNGCPLTELTGAGIVDWSRKYRGEYLWMRIHAAFGGGELHFRTTGEKAVGQLGKDMNGISYDEAAFDPHFDFIVNEVLHMRRLSTGGQLWIVGTSTEGLTSFADRWEEGNPDAPDRHRDSVSVRISTRENIGYGIDQQMFDRIVAKMPSDLVPQNIDGFFIQGSHAFFDHQSVDRAFIKPIPNTDDTGLPEIQAASNGHRYVQGCDPALRFDSTWSIVLDGTFPGVATGVFCDRRVGRQTGPSIAALATNTHLAYNVPGLSGCETGLDATGFGGKMFADSLEIKPVRLIEFGGTKARKLRYLNTLKRWLEEGKLRLPRSGKWLELRRQLLGYRLDDKGLDTDAVMALAIAVWLLDLTPNGSVGAMPFDYFHSSHGVIPSEPPMAGPRIQGASYRSLTDFLREGS